MTATAAGHSPGLHGPRCWAISAAVGVLLGIALASAFPPRSSTPARGAPDEARVREILPDGAALERLSPGTTVPWRDDRTPGQPASEPAAAPAGPHDPAVPLALSIPFALLLTSIALMPFISRSFWHRHYPDFAFLLGGLVAAYYLIGFGERGRHDVLHAGLEYYGFIALVGGLYVTSGGILIDIRTRATPLANTALLAAGALLASAVGTTGASVLLIRPFMRMNRGRLRPLHIVMFIFIVSNCGGCLTPIGDPPLYLGFLKGVPFSWSIRHLWPMWALCNGLLLGLFFLIDLRIGPARVDHLAPTQEHAPIPGVRAEQVEYRHAIFEHSRRAPIIVGLPAVLCLALIVAAVFLDPFLESRFGIAGFPFGATVQVVVAAASWFLTRPSIHHANAFTFDPVKEVGFLFVGIFLTMIPALGYLSANAGRLGLESPTQFYFFTGGLSAFLDNAPTYLTFLQGALGVLHLPLDAAGLDRFIHNTYEVIHPDGATVRFEGQALLEAISLGAVLFGAMTYIGNGPNFMVKSIAESSGLRMPSFIAYALLAVLLLLPVLIAVWFIFIR